MLSKRQKHLLVILKEADEWCKSSFLAKNLKVTPRTIRNDVSCVNCEYKNLIKSSNSGYRLNSGLSLPIDVFSADKYAGKDERISYLLSKLLIAHGKMNLYDMADELFVSYQTIEKDVREMELQLKHFGLCMVKKAEWIKVEGSEYNRRKLLSNLIYRELNNNLYNLINYSWGDFKDTELNTIKHILCDILKENNISANEYTINALVLHLNISIQRIKENQIIGDDVYGQPSLDGYEEFILAKQVTQKIHSVLGVEFPLTEICYLAYHMIGKIKPKLDGITLESMEKYINQRYIDIAKNLLNEVREAYGLDLYSKKSDTFIHFVFHIRNLMVRMRNNLKMKNPIEDRLKKEYPLIYEIGVIMAGKLSDMLSKTVGEEEIAFLAIYVGAFLENKCYKETDNERVKTLLVCPQYMAIQSTILSTINKQMGDVLNFTKDCGKIEPDYSGYKVNLILSTIPLGVSQKTPMQEIVVIRPFPSKDDFEKISNAVERIQKYKSQRKFAETTLTWFRKKLFFTSDGCNNEWDAIRKIGNEMQKLGCVGNDFVKQVIRREKLSSTTYGGEFAIPHSTDMDANTTCIGVMMCRNPLKWGLFKVSIVFLIAINSDDRHSFTTYYDSLVGLLAHEENLKKLYGARDFDDFIGRIREIL